MLSTICAPPLPPGPCPLESTAMLCAVALEPRTYGRPIGPRHIVDANHRVRVCDVDPAGRIHGNPNGRSEGVDVAVNDRGLRQGGPIGAAHVVHANDPPVPGIRNVDPPLASNATGATYCANWPTSDPVPLKVVQFAPFISSIRTSRAYNRVHP